MRILVPALFLVFLITACTGRENPTLKARKELSKMADSVARPKPDTLHFVVEDRPCYAVIDRRYLDFGHRSEFPLSLFVTLETRKKDRNGHPDPEEARAHAGLLSEIVASLDAIGVNAYIGKTTMTGFEDLIFYVREADQPAIRTRLEELQRQNRVIREYTFEQDPQWEAVSEFFEAMNKGQISAP
ncbi:MAG TPA: DUF695 domain-containing protein [Sphingobacteriaceae bacterium]